MNSKEHYTYLDLSMPTAPQSWSFDLMTKLYLCSDLKSAVSCTVSRLQLAPVYNQYPGHLGDFTPVSHAFYPLIDGKLSSLTNSSDSAYFGDNASSPSWDSSNSFVQISSKAQFLTFLLPLIPQDPILATTITVSLWIRMTSLPSSEATIFSLINDNGTPVYSLTVEQTKHSNLILTGTKTFFYPPLLISLNTWQFLTFTLYIPPASQFPIINLSLGRSFSTAIPADFPNLSATLLQVGDPINSFIGDISAIRILSPGAGSLLSSKDDICSLNNPAEILSGPCPIDPVTPFIETSEALCFSLIEPNDSDHSNKEETKEDKEEEKAPKKKNRKGKGKKKRSDPASIKAEESGLSGAVIAVIGIGSMIGGAAISSAIGSFIKMKITSKDRVDYQNKFVNEIRKSEGSIMEGPSIVISMDELKEITVEDKF